MRRLSKQTDPLAAPARETASWHLLEELELKLPFWRYHALYSMAEYSFLLDSAKDPEKLGQFSFLGGDPYLIYKAKRQPIAGESDRDKGEPGASAPRDSVCTAQIEVARLRDGAGQPLPQPETERRTADPFEDLKQVMARHVIDYAAYADHPIPFLSGAVGYFGYEAGYFVEKLPDEGADDLALPDIYFMFCDTVLGHSHQTGKSYLSIVGRGETETAARQRAEELRDQLLARLTAFEQDPPAEWRGPDPEMATQTKIEVRSFFDQEGYASAVQAMKEHIFAGDIFEACMTHRFDAPLVGGDAWDLYQELRRINPAPFASFLNFPAAQVVSSSPERYVSVSPKRIAESRPIKGTRPRGATPEEDAALKQSLFSAVKDRAENVMIVDLVRNDFGRVCKFHSVHVPELMIIEEYATVFQMVSTIRGELEDGVEALDLVKATFPGGSMTGAPKIEAMKIIDRLEPVKRGIYSGSIGYLDFAGHLDLNIVIRTFVVKDGRCYFNVGGAVVADSDPIGEYQETLDKARALKTALRNVKATIGANKPP